MTREFELKTYVTLADDIRFRLEDRENGHVLLDSLSFGEVLNLRNEAIRVATTINELANQTGEN